MKNLKKMKLFTLLAIATFLLAGCYPQAAVIWSHDGQHGAVLTKNEIYLCDSQGKLSTESLKYSGAVAWSPNSDDLYYVQPLMINSWKEAAKYVDAKKQAELIALAKDALAKLQPESLKDDKNNPFAKFEPEDTILMLLYLKDNQADELKTKLDAKTLQGIAKAKAQLNQLFVCKNCNTAQPQLILSTFMNIENLKISPNGKAVEFSKSGKTLYVCDMKGRVSLIAQNAAILPDWTSDGNTLIYSSTNNGGIQPPRLTYTQDKKSWRINTSDEIYDVSGGNMSYEYKNGKFSAIGHNVTIISSTSGNKLLAETFIYVYDQNNSAASSTPSDKLQLGSIKKVKIFDERGEMFKKFPDATELAGIVFHDTCKIRCLKNGWIIFSSVPLSVPATTQEMPQSQSLFAITPELPSTIINIIPKETQRQMGSINWDTFQMSPDQTRIAVLSNDKSVKILNLKTSNIQIVQPPLAGLDAPVLPTWQNNENLCILTCKESADEKVYMVDLWSNGSRKTISTGWPKIIMQGIVDKYRSNKSAAPVKAAIKSAETEIHMNMKSCAKATTQPTAKKCPAKVIHMKSYIKPANPTTQPAEKNHTTEIHMSGSYISTNQLAVD